ncbi:MAG: isochorismatase family cysteine hydrolase [Bryobacteraceae bacterium]
MPVQLSFDKNRSAVLCMDYQTSIVSIYAKNPDMTARAADLLAHTRSSGMRAIYVQVGFRAGFPEIGARSGLFHAMKNSERHRQLFEGTAGAIHPAVAPEGNDVVITKHRVSAFAGTDLDLILRANDIDTLILFGIATSGVVLSTLLHAADADYRLVVIKDCCADIDPDLHASLVDKLFPSRAAVVTAGEFLEALRAG